MLFICEPLHMRRKVTSKFLNMIYMFVSLTGKPWVWCPWQYALRLTSRVSTVYLLYLFVLLLIVFTPRWKMWLLISDRKLLDMTPFFMSFSPTFEDDTFLAWWVFFFHSSRICAHDGRKVSGVRRSSFQLLCKKPWRCTQKGLRDRSPIASWFFYNISFSF